MACSRASVRTRGDASASAEGAAPPPFPSTSEGGGMGGGDPRKISFMSSSDSPITPIRVPDGTVVPSGTRILRSVPDANASRSITALSVSISASTSPLSTRSPSALRHFTTTPSSIESVSLGMITRLATSLSPCQYLTRRGHHLVHVRDGGVLEVARVRHRRVTPGDADARAVQVIEHPAIQALGDLRAEAGKGPALLNDDDLAGFLRRRSQGRQIQRAQRTRVDHFRLDAFLCQLLGRFQRYQQHFGIGDERHIGPRSLHLRDAERDRVVAVSDFALHGVQSEEHTSELQSRGHLVCRLLLEKKSCK